MKSITAILLLSVSLNALSQLADSTSTVELEVLEVPAEFPGGRSAFYKYIADNITYPTDAKELGIEGKVYVQFDIDKEGNVDTESVKVVRGVFKSLNDEAIRILRESPKWIPGRKIKGGPPVRMRSAMPIIFQLSEKPKKKGLFKN